MCSEVTFEIDVQFAICPPDSKQWKRTFNIFPIGLPDRLTVHLEMICKCDCEKSPEKNEKVNTSAICNGNGAFECGICKCLDNRYGKLCECDGSQNSDDSKDSCVNLNDIKPCSGVGTCRCGQCHCNSRQNPEEKYSGKFCECNNFSCDKNDGKICSGHGFCDCGVCKCHQGWTEQDCSCKVGTDDCIGEDGKICSGRGVCTCGSCICNRTEEEEYLGIVSEVCSTSPGKCNEFKECVECWFQNQAGANVTCPSCNTATIVPLEKIEVQEKEKLCAFEDKGACRYAFKYAFDEEKKATLSIRLAKECPVPLPVVAIVSGVAGGVVATGLFLLMLWKILTTIHDRRELAKFENERLKAKWNQDDNPIYVGATSTFQNPAYRGE